MEENEKKVHEEKKENLSSKEIKQVKNIELENIDANEKKIGEEKKENLSSEENVQVKKLELENKDPNEKKDGEEKKETLSSKETEQVNNLILENKDPNEKKDGEEKKETLSSKETEQVNNPNEKKVGEEKKENLSSKETEQVKNLILKNKDNNIEEKTSDDENVASEEKNSIKSSIEKIISLCKNDSTQYTKILFDLFCDLQYKFFHINSLNILPIIPFKNLLENFYNYQNSIEKKIKSVDPEKEIDLYNCLSCIYGAYLGDSLGSYCEFSGANPNNSKGIFIGTNIFGKPAGTVTDDSEMAISLSYSILDLPNIKNLNPEYIYYYYLFWINSHPFDCGNTIRNSFRNTIIENITLETCTFEKNKNYIAIINDGSLANGFLMRISPLVIWFYYLYNKEINEIIKGNIKEKFYEMYVKIKSESIKDNQLTHPNYENNLASGFFIFMSLSSIVKNNPKKIIEQIEFILENGEEFQKDRKSKMYKAKLMNEIKKIKDENFNKFDYFKDVVYSCGYYFHALRMTIHYLYHFDDYKDENDCTKYRLIMNEICNFGGDTDTNCAIVGTVIGPLIGYFNFGDEDFNILIKLKKRQRIQFSSFIMYDYVKFLEKNVEDIENGKYVEDKKPRYNTLRWFLEILYGVKDDK